jgi:hypothetical protein
MSKKSLFSKERYEIWKEEVKRDAAKPKNRGMGKPHRISREHKGCVWHHINRIDVVATPVNIHRHFRHNIDDGSALKIEGVLG